MNTTSTYIDLRNWVVTVRASRLRYPEVQTPWSLSYVHHFGGTCLQSLVHHYQMHSHKKTYLLDPLPCFTNASLFLIADIYFIVYMLRDEVSKIPYMSGCVLADSWKSFLMFHIPSSSVRFELGLRKCVTLVEVHTLKQCMHFAQIGCFVRTCVLIIAITTTTTTTTTNYDDYKSASIGLFSFTQYITTCLKCSDVFSNKWSRDSWFGVVTRLWPGLQKIRRLIAGRQRVILVPNTSVQPLEPT